MDKRGAEMLGASMALSDAVTHVEQSGLQRRGTPRAAINQEGMVEWTTGVPSEPVLNRVVRNGLIHAYRAALQTSRVEVITTAQHQYPWPEVAAA